MILLLDSFMASLKGKASSIEPYFKGEVWSLLSALEVPHKHEKNYICHNHIHSKLEELSKNIFELVLIQILKLVSKILQLGSKWF